MKNLCEPLKAHAFICLIITAALLCTACATSHNNFKEDEWMAQANGTGRDMLYAPHLSNGRFFNPWLPDNEFGFIDIIKWKCFSRKRDYTVMEKEFRPAVIPDVKKRILSLPKEKNFIVWTGHNTFIVRIQGALWIFDPVFSDRVVTYRRKTPPALSVDEAARLSDTINIVISHNHPDHLDARSIAGLPRGSKVYVPLGLKKYLLTLKKDAVAEMDWWQEADAGGGAKLACVPAQHWSRSIAQDRNTTLWASFILVTPAATIYFGGDSGYFTGYREIGEKYPGIDYALFSASAYHPRWFMHYMHMNIDEALRAFAEMKARCFIPGHWGAFQLADEPVGYPALDLKRHIEASGLDRRRFRILDIGEILEIP